MATVTLQQLIDLGACQSALDKFKNLFGDHVEVTEALCLAHASKFDWGWAADGLLSGGARAEYRRITAPERAEYRRITAPERAEFGRIRVPDRAEYRRIKASARAELNRVKAQTFARLFNQYGE